MAVACVLAIDLGTSSCKVCAVGADGRLRGVAGCPYPVLTPRAGWSEQDACEWMPAVERALAQLWEAVPGSRSEVTAITLSSAAHIPVLLDGAGEPLRPAILWNDVRSGDEAARLVLEMGDGIFAETCNQASTTWSLPQLLWVQAHEPDLWRRVRRICLSKDYLFHHLTGRFVTDSATAVSTLLYDVRVGQWSETLCARLGISAEILPEVAPAAAPAGVLRAAVAERFGLPHGIPVMPGTLDSVAETFSTGAVQAGQCIIRLGTGGGVQLLRPGPIGHPQLISYPYPVVPLWLSQAATNACGASVEWAARALGLASPEALNTLAMTVSAGADGALFHPYLSGERTPYWNGGLRGSFVGLSLAHTPAHLARAVLEGIAYSLKDAFSIFGREGENAAGMTIVGGGAKSAALTRILCDVFARQVRVDPEADSAYGAALIALDRANSHAGVSPASYVLEPHPDACRYYTHQLDEYRWVAARLGELTQRRSDPGAGQLVYFKETR